MSRTDRTTAGFTLIEILIALAIFGIVIAQAFAVFGAQHVTYAGTERSIEIQQDSRLLTNAVLNDIRMAGYMVPRQVGIGSVDGGNAAPDSICVSDPNVIADSRVAGALDRFEGATNSLNIGPSATGSISLSAGSQDIDGDGNNDFAIDAGIILASTTRQHCAKITNIAGNVITFVPSTPPGFTIAALAGTAAPAIFYEVVGTDLERNGFRLTSGVEDLQIEFGVDTNGDGQLTGAEFPIHDLASVDASAIRSTRLSVLTRTDRQDDEGMANNRPAAGNRTAGADDSFRRRRITSTVVPRNLL